MDPLTLILSSAVVSAITTGLITHFSNRKIDTQQRTMEIRKELYTKITNQMAFFLDTVKDEESNKARNDLLKYFREIQIWGSDHVVINFKKLLDLMSPEKLKMQDERNLQFKNFIISMREDILGKTALKADDIDIRGIKK